MTQFQQSAEVWNEFLARLTTDGEDSGTAYDKLRQSLIRFFELKGDFEPPQAADETLDRVALKISQNVVIENVTKYSFGVARFIFLERIKQINKEKIARAEFYGQNDAPDDGENDAFRFLRECFDALPAPDKNLLSNYFADLSPSVVNQCRREISAANGTSLNGLRLKIFYLRRRLLNCVKKKLN